MSLPALPVFPKLDNTLGSYFIGTYIGLMYVFCSCVYLTPAMLIYAAQFLWYYDPTGVPVLPSVPVR